MTIYVFGNPDLPEDALPLRLVPRLRRRFPAATIVTPDPNEEWDVLERLIVVDTAVGLEQVRIFDGLEHFQRTPRVTMHDFDALTQLRLLQKIGRVKHVVIIGIPPHVDEEQAYTATVKAILQQSE